jgi:hypothetical protein
LITTSFIVPSSPTLLYAFITYINELVSRDHLFINVEYIIVKIFFLNIFWKIVLEMATPSVYLRARKKLYIIPANNRSAAKAEAYAAKL